LNEPELIHLARQGNQAAYEALYAQHRGAVFRMAYLILGEAGDAEDIAQETFIHASRALDRFDDTRPLRPWLLKIATNLSYNRQRAAGRYVAAIRRWLTAEAEPYQDDELSWLDSEIVRDKLRTLSQADQSIIRLRYFMELSEQETADTLGIPLGTVKSRLHRALGRLRASLEGEPAFRRDVLIGIVAVILFLLLLLSVPEVRAAIARFFQLGAVIIQVEPTTPTPTVPNAPTLAPTPTLIASLRDLSGRVTLEEATAKAGFPVRLPRYPDDLGQPDSVFLQYVDGQLVVLVWMDKQNPNRIRLSLHILGKGARVYKEQPKIIENTTVNGTLALWVVGDHLVSVQSGKQWTMRRLITGRVLIWVDGDVTYRLESDLPLDETRKIAESIR